MQRMYRGIPEEGDTHLRGACPEGGSGTDIDPPPERYRCRGYSRTALP